MQRYVSEIVSGQIRRYNVFRGYEKNSYAGTLMIRGWLSDYQNLKKARNLRNEIVHSSNSIANNICTEEDIFFVRSFRELILQQRDPIFLLKRSILARRYSNDTSYSTSNISHNKSKSDNANNIYQNSNYQTNNYKTNRFDSQPKKSLSVFPAILAVAFILLLLFMIF